MNLPYYRPYNPMPSLENGHALLYWDWPIVTDRLITANKPEPTTMITEILITLIFWCNIFFLVFYEPTDRRKAVKALSCDHHINYASPNIMELRAMANYLKPNNNISKSNNLEEIINLSKIVLNFIDVLIVTRGSAGVVTIKAMEENTISSSNTKKIEVRQYVSEVLNTVENVSGAGDCFFSGFINGHLLGLQECESIGAGFSAAKDALLSKKTVPDTFKKNNYETKVIYNSWYY
ncbi:unnamed protein product [Euphydryas editha]|uniref:Carbohydrate kinase PfkB domain-containing protein n=1 Tax=Euphydryas editha TaxID=104508 RepID=A0AAU9UMJ4_EUPED|nr:unnamed protein product [Euphydryas editha]